jgi:DNA-binding LacI/PurR family transcriptional regulator
MVTLQSKGIKIPADVSLAVFGDTPGGADSVWPTMTCISTPVNEIITEILDDLHKRIDLSRLESISGQCSVKNLGPRREITYPGKLVVRESTAPPANA